MRTNKKIITSLGGLLLLAFLSAPLLGQISFEKADNIAANFDQPYADVKELANKLTESLDTDIEKARIFFMWMAHNVRYDCKKYHKDNRMRIAAPNKETYLEKLKELREEQIEKTAKYKKGICGDYSRLFKAMCDEVGIEAVIIIGNARNFYNPFVSNHTARHAWNAVKLDDEWHLLDATWGAGTADAGVTKFTRRLSPGYFLTSPAVFALNHFPDEEKWQLLDTPLSKKDFSNQPLINYGQIKYRIKDFSVTVDDNKEIWIEFENVPKMMAISTKKSKPVKYNRKDSGQKVVLSILGNRAQSVIVYGGKSQRGRLGWLAKYKM